jgi:hypothetical protein
MYIHFMTRRIKRAAANRLQQKTHYQQRCCRALENERGLEREFRMSLHSKERMQTPFTSARAATFQTLFIIQESLRLTSL